ncbi:MAG TPA: hypothetical protein VHU61_18750 [Solirubrobacteraceae bacterium]|jgi:hypothetical protein|nr:hypothetical protein [Solirubrobacteraceae bacterium]
MNAHHIAYDDGSIRCDEQVLSIRRYYPWGTKRIPYASIRSVETLPLTGLRKVRRWRLWGSGDFVHWWNLDPHRPGKRTALVLDTGHRIRPTITPDDPPAVVKILNEAIG